MNNKDYNRYKNINPENKQEEPKRAMQKKEARWNSPTRLKKLYDKKANPQKTLRTRNTPEDRQRPKTQF